MKDQPLENLKNLEINFFMSKIQNLDKFGEYFL